MSSPDPLNDSATEAVIMPSSVNRITRSVTRSLRSDRFTSRESSPRKQTFELEVGDNKAPQRLLVTVETEGTAATASGVGTRRKLFQSSSPMPTIRQRERATTTVVPLKETIEEEMVDVNATPRRRGRPRKSNGTPIPSAGTKRRAGTPIKRTPRRPRKTKSIEEDGIEEPKLQPTPRSTRRGRPPKNRNTEPSSELGIEPVRGITSISRGRKRRQALAPEESMEMTSELPELALNNHAESQEDNEVTLITLPPSEANEPEAPRPMPTEPRSEADSDIWMATLDDEPTPRVSRTTQPARAPSPPESDYNSSQVDDFGYLAPAGSDISSVNEPLSEPGRDNNDTIAQGEDFSMIFMDSLPSLRNSVNVPAEADFGDETSLIINNTLESLRESLRKSVQQHEEQNENTGAVVAHESFFASEPLEVNLSEPENLDEPERIVPEYIESDHSEVDQAELEQTESDNHSSTYGERAHIDTETIEAEPTELEQTRSESYPSEHVEGTHNTEPLEPEPIEPEHIETQHIEPEYIESEHLDYGKIEHEHTEPELTEVVEDEPVEDEPERNAPDSETRPVESAFIRSDSTEPVTEEPRKPIIRPPVPFSPDRNLSPRWLRSPRRGNVSPLRHQLLKFKARQTDDSPPAATAEKQDAPVAPAPPSPSPRRAPSRFNEGESYLDDDSFSEIPGDVLEAATPHRPRMSFMDRDAATDEDNLVGAAEEVLAVEVVAEDDEEMEGTQLPQLIEDQYAATMTSNASHLTRSEGGRLPTPDNTPPQIEVEADDQAKSTQESQGSIGVAQQRSSSPMITSEVHAQNVPDIMEDVIEDVEEELPDIGVVPEILEPQPAESSPNSRVPWPEVTPVNQLTSPLQQPQSLAPPEVGQDKVSRPLLSPIVRAGRALQSVTSDPPSPEPRESQLRSPFRSSVTRELGPSATDAQAGRRMSSSPRRPLAFPSAAQGPPISQVYEDPFGSATRHTGQISFMEALERSSGRSAPQVAQESPVDSTASSMHITPPDDVQMSWIANEGPISANLRGDVPLKELATSEETRVSVPRHQSESREVVNEVHEPPQEEEEDDLDIWEFEAQRTTPRTARQQPFGKRRRGLPSPWTKQARQSPRKDVPMTSPREEQELIQASVSSTQRTEEATTEENQGDEFSLLAQKEATKEADRAPESANTANRFDLSSFFSSPAAIPGMLAEKLLPSNARRIPGAKPSVPEPEPIQTAPTLPTSSMFPQVTQKEFQPRASSRIDLFSPVRPEQQEVRHETPSPLRRTEEEAENETEMASVSQKQNFTPRPRQPNASFFKSSTRSNIPTPPRMQLSHADIQRWQQETSAASEVSPEAQQPLLRPLPPKNASPIKSSLRSPLKPHTPGRVVEFTSSVLSPVEQVRARQMRRLSNSSAASQAGVAPQRPQPPVQTLDKENHTNASDASMPDASPSAKSPQPEPLSQTVWSRRHWLFMDELLQLRRAGPFDLSYERQADKYLGKTVKSQGEAMTLERWHLDCVDAFKAEVGGWDEAALVKRLFALILGEERRSRGVVEKPARVMFH